MFNAFFSNPIEGVEPCAMVLNINLRRTNGPIRNLRNLRGPARNEGAPNRRGCLSVRPHGPLRCPDRKRRDSPRRFLGRNVRTKQMPNPVPQHVFSYRALVAPALKTVILPKEFETFSKFTGSYPHHQRVYIVMTSPDLIPGTKVPMMVTRLYMGLETGWLFTKNVYRLEEALLYSVNRADFRECGLAHQAFLDVLEQSKGDPAALGQMMGLMPKIFPKPETISDLTVRGLMAEFRLQTLAQMKESCMAEVNSREAAIALEVYFDSDPEI